MKKPQRPQKTLFTSNFGSTIVYTMRHINGCQLRDRNANSCACPKWIYLKPRGGKAVQRAAHTPSFTEACAEAQRILRSFDPEIAAARKINEPNPGISIEACLEAYEDALKQRKLSAKYVQGCLTPFRRRGRAKTGKRPMNVSLLDYLDRVNLTARVPIERMEQLKSDDLDAWASDWRTNDLSTHLWRGKVAMFMKWAKLHDHLRDAPEFREPHRVKAGNRCGHFSDAQVEKLRQSLPFYQMKCHAMPANYATRLGAFIDLGRWVGMAICDAVLFSPRLNLDGNIVTYRRRKTGQIATVVLDPVVAARLRSIPAEEGSDPDRPFRFPASSEERNKHLWRARFDALCEFAGVTEVEMEHGGKREAHYHALRDSFAIGAISDGVSIGNVSRMLGHASTQMTQRSYLFWVQKRLDYCIADQQAALTRRAQAAQEAASAEPDAIPVIH